MYAVVATGGKRYRVEAGSELIVERLSAEPGAPITFDRILLVGDGEAVTVGTTVDGASVSGTVIGEELGEAHHLQVQAEGEVPPHERPPAAPDARSDRRDQRGRQALQGRGGEGTSTCHREDRGRGGRRGCVRRGRDAGEAGPDAQDGDAGELPRPGGRRD